ncbi:MAG: UDP-N-acetylglucosamine 1-carboxyvinyltransferase, partial [Clostridiales bacterium]|nr:UDP-N-acetylglucosamine 1-carboxyvinyltransferase [Clostridiales bacterium]
PGGCEIGMRPIDLHLKGLRALGTAINESMGHLELKCPQLTGGEIHLDYPSVGATENIMMAAVTAKGRTQIHNAAREPEIVDLARLLGSMGAHVLGAGGSVIDIEGVSRLHGCDHEVIPDRIAAGTFLVAGAMNGGTVEVQNVYPCHLIPVIAKLRETGCTLITGDDSIIIKAPARLKATSRVDTMPYPGFPTDMQAPMFVLSTIADGTTILVENVFENRFHHASELVRMGARVVLHDRMAIITGVDRLLGTRVTSADLRGGAAMVLAGIHAEGVTVVEQIHHIDRGYELFENDLRGLGADIHRI